MTKYIVKYEDYNGEVHVAELMAHSRDHAISMLSDCKIVYWCVVAEDQPN